jgi:hypothetical protein
MDVFSSSGVDEFASACGADPGVRVPTFVYAASNQAALLWRDSVDWMRVTDDDTVLDASDVSYEYALYDISALLGRIGKARADVVAYCYDCDVKWSFWSDRECWMCGMVGYLYTPRNIRSVIRYGRGQE